MDYTDKHVKCKVSIRGSFWTVFHNLIRDNRSLKVLNNVNKIIKQCFSYI